MGITKQKANRDQETHLSPVNPASASNSDSVADSSKLYCIAKRQRPSQPVAHILSDMGMSQFHMRLKLNGEIIDYDGSGVFCPEHLIPSCIGDNIRDYCIKQDRHLVDELLRSAVEKGTVWKVYRFQFSEKVFAFVQTEFSLVKSSHQPQCIHAVNTIVRECDVDSALQQSKTSTNKSSNLEENTPISTTTPLPGQTQQQKTVENTPVPSQSMIPNLQVPATPVPNEGYSAQQQQHQMDLQRQYPIISSSNSSLLSTMHHHQQQQPQQQQQQQQRPAANPTASMSQYQQMNFQQPRLQQQQDYYHRDNMMAPSPYFRSANVHSPGHMSYMKQQQQSQPLPQQQQQSSYHIQMSGNIKFDDNYVRSLFRLNHLGLLITIDFS